MSQTRGDDEWRGLKRVFRFPSSRRRVRADVDAEIAFHLEERAEELASRDHLSGSEAAQETARRFGDVASYRRQLHAIDGVTFRRAALGDAIGDAGRELRQALRSLRRSPSFSLLAMFTLALGLGASTTIFTLLDRIVIQPLEYPHANRLIRIGTQWPGIKAGEEYELSKYMYHRFQERSRTLDRIGLYKSELFTLPAQNGLDAERLAGVDASASMFSVLGIRPELGHAFSVQDQLPMDPPVVLLSHDLWRRRFGGDPNIIGKTIDLDGRLKEVVGILPAGAQLPEREAELWVPLHLDPAEEALNNHVYWSIALLKAGVTPKQSYNELASLTRQITAEHPDVYEPSFLRATGFALFVRSLHDDVVGPDIARSLWIIFGSVGLVLLISAANVASLFLIRIDARRREIAVRIALGAHRWRLAMHFFSESMLLAGGGMLGAIALAYALLRVVLAFAPEDLPRLQEVRLDWWSLAFCAMAALLVGVIFGLLPFVRARVDSSMLREGARGLTSSRGQSAARRALVVAQVALSVVLLVSAGLLTKSFAQLRAVRSGLDPRNVLSMSISLPPDRYGSDAQIVAFWRELARRTELMPLVTSTGAISSLPFAGALGCSSVNAEDSSLPPAQRVRCVPAITVAPGYFATMRISMDGDEPGWDQNEAGSGTMVVSKTLANRLWPGESAIGHTLVFQERRRLVYRISGVASDVRADGLDHPPIEAAYFPLAAPASAGSSPTTDMDGNFLSFVVRSSNGDQDALGAAIRRTVTEMDSRVPVSDVRSMDEIVAKSMARSSFTMLLLAIAAAIALTLSAVGIYGVISFTVAQRRSEIGVRMALGAKMAQMRTAVVGQSVRLVGLGAIAGVLLAVAAMQVVRSLLFQVSPADPGVLAGAAVVLLAVALIASYVPARRAAAIDPAESLRAE